MIPWQKERQSVADAGRMLLNEGLIVRTWGNISCRTGEDSFVITASGLGYENMQAEDVVPVNLTTEAWDGPRKPSVEVGIHAAAYRAFPEAGFVIHTHQPYATALSLTGLEAIELTQQERESLSGLAIAAYGLPGQKGLRDHVATEMKSGAHCVLMAHHGAVVVGNDLNHAMERIRLLEAVCKRACKGQPEAVDAPDADAALQELLKPAQGAFAHVSYTTAPAVQAASGKSVPAQLDDMAQMIGARIPCVPPEPERVLAALQKHSAVLVSGLGGVCRADTEGDCVALCALMEKACIAFLHTGAMGVRGRLSPFDTLLMRAFYLKSYSKKING